MNEQNGSVSKDTVFSVIASEAGGFYKFILTVASSFLGGSLVFIEKIAPEPLGWSLWILGLSWLCLIGSILAVCWVRRKNLDSGWKFLENELESARKIDQRTRKWSTIAIAFLTLGVFSLMAFGMINYYQKTILREETSMAEKNKSIQPAPNERKSIPFGSITPAQPGNSGQGQGQGNLSTNTGNQTGSSGGQNNQPPKK